MSLQQAPAHVVLAVDLIELLENNRIPAATVLAALPLLQQDYQRKLAQEQAADPTGTASSRKRASKQNKGILSVRTSAD